MPDVAKPPFTWGHGGLPHLAAVLHPVTNCAQLTRRSGASGLHVAGGSHQRPRLQGAGSWVAASSGKLDSLIWHAKIHQCHENEGTD